MLSIVPQHVSLAGHLSEDALEAYVMNELSADDQTRLEEHVLVCNRCCDNLGDAFAFIAALKSALLDFQNRGKAIPFQ